MTTREHLDTLLSENRPTDRPEVRAKSSLGLVSFVTEKAIADEAQNAEMLQDAWIGLFRGLSDDWPLVKDAFREQLIKALRHSDEFLEAFKDGALVDQILSRMKQPAFANDRICVLTGIMSLSAIVQASNEAFCARTSVTRSWGEARIENIICMVMDGWRESPTADQVVRAIPLLRATFSAEQLVRSLGGLVTLRYLASNQASMAIKFCTLVLQELPEDHVAHGDPERDSTNTAVPAIDNVYTLHRLMIACAAFTNPKDLWNKHDVLISSKTMARAYRNLDLISKSTPWSDAGLSTTSSKAARDHHLILVPGNFSSNVLQILDQEIRPCFTNKRAERLARQAQSTIAIHKDKVRQAIDTGTDGGPEPSKSIVSSKHLDVVRHQQQRATTNAAPKRFRIARIGDTPNDKSDDLLSKSAQQLASLPHEWYESFFESVAIMEWCAQQPIQDNSRIHEVFILLVGPILTMMDSPQKQHSVRGLDILTRFLIQYHQEGASSGRKDSCTGSSKSPVDSRIWIKIFERTGIDQLLEENLRPLLAPPSAGSAHDNEPEAIVHLEALQAAYRTYLTLVMVNTEPEDLPSSDFDGACPNPRGDIHAGTSGDANGSPLSVETLFVQGVLGSFMRANNSREYLILVLEWMKCLVARIIPFDFILVQLPQNYMMEDPCSDMNSDKQLAAGTQTGFQEIYGMGARTIKYLATLLQHICNIFQYPFPSPSSTDRLEALNLASKASEALFAVMKVSRPRIPRYRGVIMAAVANCWANSRIVSLEASNLPGSPPAPSMSPEMKLAQKRLDDNLIRLMQLCRDICQPRITGEQASGYEMDMKVLRDLDPTVFDELFTSV
ncbi:hypothetical protein BGZ70_008225 [Mortierella alpina]|uniref:Uncharacterized protein n=1 Tax=Mortierella alpina TaxID=64518 RepID=A0A9P6M219_MORAP|nr:hypothetical protein BGZ70_008225 [Mortierella alpina]